MVAASTKFKAEYSVWNEQVEMVVKVATAVGALAPPNGYSDPFVHCA